MTFPFRILLTVGVGAAVLAGCAAPSRFEWGAYEGSLYAYAKRPDQRATYRAALETAIAQGRKTNRLAPGLLAELGYISLEDGDTVRALQLFEEEMTAFPESRAFLAGIVARAKGEGVTKKAEMAS